MDRLSSSPVLPKDRSVRPVLVKDEVVSDPDSQKEANWQQIWRQRKKISFPQDRSGTGSSLQALSVIDSNTGLMIPSAPLLPKRRSWTVEKRVGATLGSLASLESPSPLKNGRLIRSKNKIYSPKRKLFEPKNKSIERDWKRDSGNISSTYPFPLKKKSLEKAPVLQASSGALRGRNVRSCQGPKCLPNLSMTHQPFLPRRDAKRTGALDLPSTWKRTEKGFFSADRILEAHSILERSTLKKIELDWTSIKKRFLAPDFWDQVHVIGAAAWKGALAGFQQGRMNGLNLHLSVKALAMEQGKRYERSIWGLADAFCQRTVQKTSACLCLGVLGNFAIGVAELIPNEIQHTVGALARSNLSHKLYDWTPSLLEKYFWSSPPQSNWDIFKDSVSKGLREQSENVLGLARDLKTYQDPNKIFGAAGLLKRSKKTQGLMHRSTKLGSEPDLGASEVKKRSLLPVRLGHPLVEPRRRRKFSAFKNIKIDPLSHLAGAAGGTIQGICGFYVGAKIALQSIQAPGLHDPSVSPESEAIRAANETQKQVLNKFASLSVPDFISDQTLSDVIDVGAAIAAGTALSPFGYSGTLAGLGAVLMKVAPRLMKSPKQLIGTKKLFNNGYGLVLKSDSDLGKR